MKTFNKFAAQGEIFIRRVDSRPNDLKLVQPENGRHTVSHSETGHSHVMDAEHVTLMERTKDVPEGLRILHLIVEEPTVLEHLRPTDTHDPILFGPGEYEVRLQREYTPEGYRRVAD